MAVVRSCVTSHTFCVSLCLPVCERSLQQGARTVMMSWIGTVRQARDSGQGNDYNPLSGASYCLQVKAVYSHLVHTAYDLARQLWVTLMGLWEPDWHHLLKDAKEHTWLNLWPRNPVSWSLAVAALEEWHSTVAGLEWILVKHREIAKSCPEHITLMSRCEVGCFIKRCHSN